MIYDCFLFFNELDLLELRLHELAEVVDKFVLVEATRTFTNKPKPLHYQENRAQFAAFQKKIIHIIVDDSPNATDPWVVERFQRNCIARGLTDCRPDDWVLVSDLDEIPRASVLEKLSREIPFHDNFFSNLAHAALSSKLAQKIFHRKGLRRLLRKNHPFVWRFEQPIYLHFLNARALGISHGTRMLRFRDFTRAEEMRHSGYKTIPDAGWHFTWMGKADHIRQKMGATSHQNINKKILQDQPQSATPEIIASRFKRGVVLWDETMPLKFVPLDDSFPRYVMENREKYSYIIKPMGEAL